ncbi:hypothetical protein Tco_0722891 [Tanacetum coccineum]
MEHYLAHTDYPIWEVIQNGNGPVSITTDTQGQIKVLLPRTAEEILARERERKARTTLLIALPEDHLAKFHKMADAKEMWDAIKSRFGGNDESKKMQKYILNNSLKVSLYQTQKDCIKVSLIMRTKPGVDSLSFDDMYNNLRVFENDVKGSTASSSSTQNVAFVSENTSSTNDVAMISMKMKKFYKKTGRKLQFDAKEPVGFDKTKNMDSHSKEEEDYALMAYNNSGSDTEREQLSDASIEIKAYTQDLDDKTDVLTYHKKLLAEAQKEKEDLKAKVEKWHNSSKNLGGNMHAVPPPMTGNYMSSGPDVEIDYSQFTYGPNQTQPSESETQTSDFDACLSDYSVETHESLPEPTVNELKVVNQPKVVPTNAAIKVNTVKPIVNRLVLLGEKGKLLLSPQHVIIGDKKDITGKISPNTIVDQDYPHKALKVTK